jgi:hypothetical protein
MNFILLIGWNEPWRGRRLGFYSWVESYELTGERAGYGLRLGYFYISVGRDLVDG